MSGISNWAASLRIKDFRLLWASTLLYSLATGMEQVSVGWLIFELTGSELMVGVGAAARMLPFFLLGLLSGAVADRWDRRMLVQVGTLGASAVALVMALMLLGGLENVWVVVALVAALGCTFAFVLTVRQTFTYDIVGPEYALNGLALGAMAMQGGGIVGSLVSGAVIEAAGAGWQFAAAAVCYLLSALATLTIRDPGRSIRPAAASVLQNLAGYVRLLRNYRLLLVLMLLTAATEILGFTHMTLLPVFAKEVLHVGPTGLGIMTAARQGGGLLGLWILAGIQRGQEEGADDVRHRRGIRRRADGVLPVGQHLFLHRGAAVRQRLRHGRRYPLQDPDAGRSVRRGTRAGHGFLGAEHRIRPGGPRGGGRAGRGRGRAPGPAHQRRGAGRHQRRLRHRPAPHTASGVSAVH